MIMRGKDLFEKYVVVLDKISKHDIIKDNRVLENPIISDKTDIPLYPEYQIQTNGVDLSVEKIEEIDDSEKENYGIIDMENTKRKIPKTINLPFTCNSGGYLDKYWMLEPGTYIIQTAEYVKIPLQKMALCLPRSTLLRSGATIYTAVGDQGYHGKYRFMLQVFNPHGIKIYNRARVAQIVFLDAEESIPYAGIYHGTK